MKDADCVAFLQWALPQLDLRWAGFRKVRRQVCKRLGRRLEELGLDGLEAYRARLASDPGEWSALDAMCRITISRFYRDKGVFRALTEIVLPRLAERAQAGGRSVSCWSAGCASGEEAYTLKIIWDALVSPALGYRNGGMEMTVIGTDVDDAVLERARIGCYRRGSLRELPEALMKGHFAAQGDVLCVSEEHRRGVSFINQDIRTEMPAGPFDLVLCRNLAFTYFEPRLQWQVLRRLATRLRPDGFLVVGAHEALPDGTAGFAPLPECRQILQYVHSTADAADTGEVKTATNR